MRDNLIFRDNNTLDFIVKCVVCYNNHLKSRCYTFNVSLNYAPAQFATYVCQNCAADDDEATEIVDNLVSLDKL